MRPLTIAMLVFGLGAINQAHAQSCSTVTECAQEMLDVAADLKAENERLSARVLELEKALGERTSAIRSEISRSLDAVRSKSTLNYVNNGGNGISEMCPQGQYMVGAKWLNTSGGPNGIIAWFAPVCREL